MDDAFDNLRVATTNCLEEAGETRDAEIFAFQNAATFTVVGKLFRTLDALQEQADRPVVASSLGLLTAEEAALVEGFRQSDYHARKMIRTAVTVGVEMAAERSEKVRCEVVSIGMARAEKPQA